ncbi:PAS domain S-box [Rivularia sp. PCC 7116]|uniref:PAS domain S-box protein n=1 Tax=Rivularia sp. PCC 7116 TaxID=373994 RepID=UPI00029EE889|nr:PAS domain S-box protein [Rivularia sp. PCC 7116]AFY53331.1 PAS domain S-box [Rivularia sp. PCC 7116]
MPTAFPAFSSLPLENLIDYAPAIVGVETTVWDVIALMDGQPPIGSVLVVENWRVVGVFSWQDALKVVKSQINLKKSKITEFMRTSVIKIKYSQIQDTASILNIIADTKDAVLIEDEKGLLVGSIAREAINAFLLENYQSEITRTKKINYTEQEIRRTEETDNNQNIESLIYFRQALENSSEGIVITDIAGHTIYQNSSFLQIFGYAAEELNALGGLPFLWKNECQYEELLANIEQGKSWRHELEMTNRKGDILHFDVRNDAIKDVTGEIIGMIGIYTNITETLKTQQALQLKNTGFNASQNGIMIFDVRLASKPIVFANPEFERICDESISQGLGFKNSFVDNIIFEINKLLKSCHYSYLKYSDIILRNYCKDGRELWYQFSVSPIFNRDRKITHYICIQTDITKHKQTEMSLLITQEKLQHMLFSSTGVIYSSEIYEDYAVTFISDNIVDITGYQSEDILCDSNFWLSHIHPEDIQLYLTELTKVFTEKKVSIEYRFLHENGNYIWIYEQSKLIKDNAGNPLEIIGYRIEITERKNLEQDLQQTLEKEKEVNELKSRFISMASHEFRTPLSTILSSSELLENYHHKWDDEKKLKHFHRINKAVQHMNSLLHDVLFLSKVEADKVDSNPQELDLVEFSSQLIEDVQINQKANKVDKADIKFDFITSHAQLIGYFDEKLLAHIFNNLISNAIKYSKSGTTITLTLDAQDSQILFEIQDEGIGIPPEDLPSLFDSFHRCNNVGNIPGTGLGLSIVKKCVDVLQGDIKVSSEVGVGTKFSIKLPVVNHS